jgi:hypothetical protein
MAFGMLAVNVGIRLSRRKDLWACPYRLTPGKAAGVDHLAAAGRYGFSDGAGRSDQQNFMRLARLLGQV